MQQLPKDKLKDFQGPCLFSRIFHTPKIWIKKFEYFQGSVCTLRYYFGFCLTDLLLWRLLQVRPGLPLVFHRRIYLRGLLVQDFFTVWVPFLSSTQRLNLMSLTPSFDGCDVPTKIGGTLIPSHVSNFGQMSFLPPPTTRTGISGVEPRFDGSRSVALTTQPWLLLPITKSTVSKAHTHTPFERPLFQVNLD